MTPRTDPRTDPAAAHFLPALPAVHDALDPEMSILKQRLARRLRHDGATDESVKTIDLGEWQLGRQCILPLSFGSNWRRGFNGSMHVRAAMAAGLSSAWG